MWGFLYQLLYKTIFYKKWLLYSWLKITRITVIEVTLSMEAEQKRFYLITCPKKLFLISGEQSMHESNNLSSYFIIYEAVDWLNSTSWPIFSTNRHCHFLWWSTKMANVYRFKKNCNCFIWWSIGTWISFWYHLGFWSDDSYTQMVLPNYDIDCPINDFA